MEQVHEKEEAHEQAHDEVLLHDVVPGHDEDEELGLNEGMTHLRGEAAKDQDKFRVTVEREQRCYGFCDETTEPKFRPGTTSVTFTGAHFRMSNVKWPEEVWLTTEVFYVNGVRVVHEAGKPLPENLAKSLRAIRREAPEFWNVMERLGFQFYQQPSGFDDAIICAWKVEQQAKSAPCSLRVVDSFGGGLSQEVREVSALWNQIMIEIEAKMTAALQVTDTDEAFRLKSIQRRKEKVLRKELMRLAEFEDTRPIFKCGVYEVLKLLVESIETLFAQFAEDETLKKAMVRNLWTVLRPNITEGKFERVSRQPWAKDLKFGTHRLRRSWVEKRFDNLGEQGFPMPLPEDKLPEPQLDASYNVEPGNLNELNTWMLMAKEGEMTEEAMRACSVLPFMEYEMSGLLDFECLEEAKALLVSPKKRRIEAGLDVMLTSQGLSHEQKRRRGQRRIERMNAQRKGVKDALVKMRPG